VGRETLRTGGKILADMADNTAPDVSAKDIVSKHVSASAQTLINKLRGRGRGRKRPAAAVAAAARSKKQKMKSAAKRIKRDIFS
jgi:hypothetical protein